MGHKVHPIGLRLGIHRKWKSNWFFESKNYPKFIHLNLNIEKFFRGFLYFRGIKSLLLNCQLIKLPSNQMFIFIFHYRFRKKRKRNFYKWRLRKWQENLEEFFLKKNSSDDLNNRFLNYYNIKYEKTYLKEFLQLNKNNNFLNLPKNFLIRNFKKSNNSKISFIYNLKIIINLYKNLKLFFKLFPLLKKIQKKNILKNNFKILKLKINFLKSSLIFLKKIFIKNKSSFQKNKWFIIKNYHLINYNILNLKNHVKNKIYTTNLDFLQKFIKHYNQVLKKNYFKLTSLKTSLKHKNNLKKINLKYILSKLSLNLRKTPKKSISTNLRQIFRKKKKKFFSTKILNLNPNPKKEILKLHKTFITLLEKKVNKNLSKSFIKILKKKLNKIFIKDPNIISTKNLNKKLTKISNRKLDLLVNKNYLKRYKNKKLIKNKLLTKRIFYNSIGSIKKFISKITNIKVNLIFINTLSFTKFFYMIGYIDKKDHTKKREKYNVLQIQKNMINRYKYTAIFIKDFVHLAFISALLKNTQALVKFMGEQFKRLPKNRKQLRLLKFLQQSLKIFCRQRKEFIGFKLQIKGRLNRRNRTHKWTFNQGILPMQTHTTRIEYSYSEGLTRSGLIGIKLWFFYKQQFRNTLKTKLIQYLYYSKYKKILNKSLVKKFIKKFNQKYSYKKNPTNFLKNYNQKKIINVSKIYKNTSKDLYKKKIIKKNVKT